MSGHFDFAPNLSQFPVLVKQKCTAFNAFDFISMITEHWLLFTEHWKRFLAQNLFGWLSKCGSSQTLGQKSRSFSPF